MKQLFSAICLLLMLQLSAGAQRDFSVRFIHGTEIFPENFAIARQNASADPSEIVNGVYFRFIQLNKVLDAPQRTAFEATGLRVIHYVPFATYLVAVPQHFDFHSIEAFQPRSVMPVNPDWKMANTLVERPFGKWAVRGNYVDINVQLYPTLSIADGAALCQKNKLEVLKQGTQNGFLQLRVHQDDLKKVAALPFIQYMELIPPPAQKEDTRGRSLHRSNLVAGDAPGSKKFDGTGVGVLVRDDGQLGPHIDLQGRLENHALGSPESGTHGDGVVGIVGGAGNLDPTKKGMAAGASLFSVDYVNDFQDQTIPLHLNEGVTITNSSYSDGCNAGYTLEAQTVDQQLIDHPTLMHVFSAGNANGSDCGYGAGTQWGNITGGHKMAKNSIATANVYADNTLETSSSRGPAYDGRLKPDITANGQDQESLNPNNGYQVFGGTSGAAPGIAGCLAQLTHAYRTIYSVNDAPSALLKATILNTANDLGNAGPDFKYGWGHINTWRALQLLEQHRWQEGTVDQNGDATQTLQIPNNIKEARIMVYWADPAASELNARALINDLDLTMTNSSGTIFQPWKLDPTPDPVALDNVAGKGRDSLNNMEQVFIENPAAGSYTIHIKGTEVPMGPQHYYVVWDFVRDEIKLTYPAGGEGFVPGETERIHWDAYGTSGTFTLRYSTDGGATFLPMGSVGGDRRMYDWVVPNTISGNIRVLILRGSKRDTSDFASTIAPVPANLHVVKSCPDALTIGWDAVNDTLTYDGFMLGQKYMELKGTSDTNFLALPIVNAGLSQWLSVRSSYPDGLAGRRAIAIQWPGGLLNCPQPSDLATRELISPAGNAIITCGDSELKVGIKLRNEGQLPSSSATAYYQIDNNAAVSESVPTIQPSDSLNFNFQTSYQLPTSGVITLKTWIKLPGDNANFNDTIVRSFSVSTQGITQPFTEDFEASLGLPIGWTVVNPDNVFTWENTGSQSIPAIGANDLEGNSMYINFFSYGPNEEGQEDYLYMAPLDLASLPNPTLTFDLAKANYDPSYVDGMRIEAYPNCNLSDPPVTIWEKFDPELSSIPDQTTVYVPGSASDWRHESVDLSAFSGQKLIIRFSSLNDYGNNLYLDNIGLQSFAPPLAQFTALDTICRLDTLLFLAAPSPGNSDYSWSFGIGAVPGTATGIGPHQVIYPAPGSKTVRLIVTNSFGGDTLSQSVNVRALANANFTSVQNGLTVTFTNSSTNANSYLWDFGDGMTSSQANPVHTYATAGNYTVTLSATNECRTNTKAATVGATGVSDLESVFTIKVTPNPTSGDFAAEILAQAGAKASINLFDAAGKQVLSHDTEIKAGFNRVPFESLNLPKGIYQLNILSGGKQATFNVIVQ